MDRPTLNHNDQGASIQTAKVPRGITKPIHNPMNFSMSYSYPVKFIQGHTFCHVWGIASIEIFLIKIIQNDTPVFLALDPDVVKKEQRIIKMFLNYGVELYTIDTRGYDDIAEMGREEFLKRKERATAVIENDYLLEQAIANI